MLLDDEYLNLLDTKQLKSIIKGLAREIEHYKELLNEYKESE
jgi:hypothetical protein